MKTTQKHKYHTLVRCPWCLRRATEDEGPIYIHSNTRRVAVRCDCGQVTEWVATLDDAYDAWTRHCSNVTADMMGKAVPRG